VRRGGSRRAAGSAAVIGIALGLAAVAGLTSFVATAGPREITQADNRAIDQVVMGLEPAQASIEASASYLSDGPLNWITPSEQSAFAAAVHKLFTPPVVAPVAASRAFEQGSAPLQLSSGAPGAYVAQCQAGPGNAYVVLSSDSDLQADGHLVAGGWPGPSQTGVPGGTAADRSGITEPVAVPQQVARLFGVHPGSVMTLATAAGEKVDLVVSGVVAPDAGALFWSTGTATATPAQVPRNPCHAWEGSVVVGAAGETGLAAILSGHGVNASWYWPVALAHLTAAGVDPLSAALSSDTNALLEPAEAAASFGTGAGRYAVQLTAPPTMSSQLPGILSATQAQLATVESLDDLVIGGLFAAGLLLMLLCAALVADRYAAEFALVRARGGSIRQVVGSALRRSTGAGLPGTAVGIVLAVVGVRTASTSLAGWVLPALTALIAVASAPAICAWRVRRGTASRSDPRADVTVPRRSARRVVAELTVLVITIAAVAALLVRGTGTGSNQLAFACPILLAATASIVVARLYPVPIRALLPVAGARRGPVTFLGLTAAGRARLRALLPALTLVLTMTLAVLGWLLTLSVDGGQLASSWAQTGADAVFSAPGAGTVTAGDLRAVAAVPGVTHAAAIYTSGSGTGYAPTLTTASGSTVSSGIAIVNPAQYAALATATPWPQFPADRLSRRTGPVPILISTTLAAQLGTAGAGQSRRTLNYFGQSLAVIVTGTVSAVAPAFPQGGSYIVYPQWAAADIPALPGPDTMLATGSGMPAAPLAAIARHMRGFQLTTRQSLLAAQYDSPAQYAIGLFRLSGWTAAALSAVALLFGLVAAAPRRRTLMTRMSALGMSSRQAFVLALFDPLALLAVGTIGMAAAAVTLALILRRVIDLAPLTSSQVAVPVQLSVAPLLIPAACAIGLALVAVAAEQLLARRGSTARALRTEEAS
jgi:putative ABC transport system permease protein